MSDIEEKSDDECEESIRQFAEIVECDEAYAHSILQDFDYDLDEVGDDDEKESSSAPEAKKPRRQEEFPLDLTLLTWNVDGIDKGNLQKRFTAVLYIIAKANPEIIFLQEMVGELLPKLMDLMEKMYHIYIANADQPYFCVTLVSKNINVMKNEVISFENTTMGRSMIVVEAEWQRLKLKLINTHLESMAEYSEKRKAQFSSCMKKLEALVADNPSETLAIFAGDLNIRDSEISTLPAGVKDAWITAGSNNENKFTWDMRRNDNKQASGARMRFDRVFYKGPYADVRFSLQGTQRIRGIHCFPSDHFAVVCRFSDPKE